MITENITVYRGATQVFNYTLKDNDGNVINLGTPTIAMVAKRQLKDSDTDKVFEKAGAVTVAASGTFSVTLTATETALDAGVYHYDVSVTISGNIYQAAQGLLHIKQDVNL